MTLNPFQPVPMIRTKEGLQQLAEDTYESPLVRELAQELAKRLQPTSSAHTFAVQAIDLGHKVYSRRCANQHERNTLLAQHIPALAQRVCPPEFTATVQGMYRTY